MSASYRLQIVTPQGIAYQGEVMHSFIPAETGFVGVLANHAPFITSVKGGRFEIREKDGAEKQFSVGAGFFEVLANQATLLVQSVQTDKAAS